MGQTDSKQLSICSFCQAEIVLNEKENKRVSRSETSSESNEQKTNTTAAASHQSTSKLPLGTFLCSRCHGFYTKTSQNSSRRKLSFNSHSNTNSSMADSHLSNLCSIRQRCRNIQHLHIAPFQDTLAAVEEKEVCGQYIIDTYLKPYFVQHRVVVSAHSRLIMRNVEFKVFGCYPPRGVVNESTRFHLNDNDGRLIQLRWRHIRQIHLLPTKASHITYSKHRDYNANNESNDNEDLLQSHLKPYLKQNDAAFYIDTGAVEEQGQNKMHRRHLMEEETFAFNGIEWRVMKCLPPDGYIDNTSTIYCHGDPVMDCNKISIRPIFESLPNLHKNYTPRQIKSFYLDPFFRGRCRYIDHSREIKIFGVDFSIRESLPSAGIITLSTMIDYNAAPVKAVELQEMQAQEDMELARQLQEEENNRSPFPSMNIHNGSNPPQYHQVTLADITEIFERLQAAQSPSNTNNPNNDPFLQFIRQLQIASQNNPRRQRNAGVNPQLIDRLPTIKYRHNQEDIVDTGDDNMDINKSCRICLEYYEAGEELRFLPCFHKYHKECVDRWFQMSSKCPICKTSISQPLRQNVQ
eukprot:204829_1